MVALSHSGCRCPAPPIGHDWVNLRPSCFPVLLAPTLSNGDETHRLLVAVSPLNAGCRQIDEAHIAMGVGTVWPAHTPNREHRAPARIPARECGSRMLTAVTDPGPRRGRSPALRPRIDPNVSSTEPLSAPTLQRRVRNRSHASARRTPATGGDRRRGRRAPSLSGPAPTRDRCAGGSNPRGTSLSRTGLAGRNGLDEERLEDRSVGRHAHVVADELASRLGCLAEVERACGVRLRPARRVRAGRCAGGEPHVGGGGASRRRCCGSRSR